MFRLSSEVVMRLGLICAGIFCVFYLMHLGVEMVGSWGKDYQHQYQQQVRAASGA